MDRDRLLSYTESIPAKGQFMCKHHSIIYRVWIRTYINILFCNR